MKKFLSIFVLSFILIRCSSEDQTKAPGPNPTPEPTVPVNVDTLDLTGDTSSMH